MNVLLLTFRQMNSPVAYKGAILCTLGIECSFRKLKYTIGAGNFHAYKPEYIKQEIREKMTAYNITELLISHTVMKQRKQSLNIK